MPKQVGLIKLEGSMGGVTFYKSGGEYLARTSGGVSAETIATSPSFERTRENNAEFGVAGIAGKQLRTVLAPELGNIKNRYLASKLTAKMLKDVVQADNTNPRGQRKPIAANAGGLVDFEFSATANRSTILNQPVNFTSPLSVITGASSSAAAEIELNFTPNIDLQSPSGATHVRLEAIVIMFDLQDPKRPRAIGKSESDFPVTSATAANFAPGIVSAGVTEDISTWQAPCSMTLLGVQFLQEVNGNMYPLNNKSYNSLQILEVA